MTKHQKCDIINTETRVATYRKKERIKMKNFPKAIELHNITEEARANAQEINAMVRAKNFEIAKDYVADAIVYQAQRGQSMMCFDWTVKGINPMGIKFKDFLPIADKLVIFLEENGFFAYFHEYCEQTKKKGKLGYLSISWAQ